MYQISSFYHNPNEFYTGGKFTHPSTSEQTREKPTQTRKKPSIVCISSSII